MDHVAIMNKKFGDLIAKILSGEKKIESRWSKIKISPWGRVKRGDVVYFKDAGKPVTASTVVSKVVQFSGLKPAKVKQILDEYGGKDGIAVNDLQRTLEWAKEKKYCVLIYLKNPKKVKPFNINKTGFGIGAAWICIRSIIDIRI